MKIDSKEGCVLNRIDDGTKINHIRLFIRRKPSLRIKILFLKIFVDSMIEWYQKQNGRVGRPLESIVYNRRRNFNKSHNGISG